MDIAERRASQDGKILRYFEGQKLEFRCATAPAKYGEKMVMRLLNSSSDMLSLDQLISNKQVREQFRSIISQANGIIIVSGPTGSGKSTTLASALREKDNGELNIVTAEDPIEYDLGGDIQQFPVIRAKGQTFFYMRRAKGQFLYIYGTPRANFLLYTARQGPIFFIYTASRRPKFFFIYG